MKQFQRGHSNTKAATADVVDLLDSDDEAAGQPQQQQQQGQMQHQRAAAGLKASSSSSGGGRASIRSKRVTAVATNKKLAQAQAISEYAGDYEFISDDDPDEYQPPKQQKQQQRKQQQPAAPKQVQLMRNHFAPSQSQQQQQQDGPQDGSQSAVGTSTQKQQAPRKPASTNNKRDAAAAGTMQPPAKRAKGSAAGRKAAPGKAGTAAGSKQTTLQSKGFGSLCFSMSQPAAGGGGGFAPLPLSSSQGMSSQEGPVSPAQPARSATPQPPAAPADDTQWVDKHEPQAPDDLIVHKRKVSEVQAWLQSYLDSRAAAPSRALLITGPSGCGKSVTLRVLANALGFEVVEWNAPVPTLWSDYQYQAGAGVGYTSKLDEFDMFVTRCKFAALPLACSTANPTQQQQQQQQASQQQSSSQQLSQQQQQQRQKGRLKLLLVEDLPYVGEPSRRARLAATLQDLATTARCPVVVVATTEEGSSSGINSSRGGGGYGGGAGAGAGASMKGLHKDILAVLDKIGAAQISFNAITANNITKALHTIADKEGFVLQQDVADGIAQAAAGDLRNAIQSLQLMHMQQQGAAAMNCKATKAAGKGKGKANKRPRRVMPKDAAAMAAADAAKQKVAGQVSRDQHLSVFHAVGKILHYKRNQPEDASAAATQQQMQQTQAAAGGSDVIDLCEAGAALQTQGSSNRHWRPPLRVDPESIIQGSGLEALQVTAFLAENYPHFIADDAMEEAAAAAAYISDAGYLACHRNTSASSSGFWDEADTVASSVQQAAAGSIAARGLLFSNIKPAPSRWLPVRGSGCFQPEKAATGNLQKLGKAVQQLQDSWAAAGALQQQAVMQLAAQLLHAGRQERASQVLPYLQVLCKHHSRMWVHQLLPRSWCYVWGGQVTERQSAAIQGPQAAAALQAAVAAAAATADTGMDPAWPDAANQGDPDGSDDQIEEDSE